MDRSAKPIMRIQENLLAKAERRLLNWLCPRLPAWTKPDHLTSLGIVGAALIFIGFSASHADRNWLWLSVAGFLVHWFGDSLDGSLARFRKIERPRFGYFIDHSADGLGTLLIVAGLGLSPFVELEVAMIALAGYLLMSIHAFLAARVVGELKLSYVAAGPTELRILLIGLTVAMYLWGGHLPLFLGYNPFDLIVGAAGFGLILLFIVQTMVTARRIALEGEWGDTGPA
ncbi:CDP-alcohol phosphatidyltransferase family protein [Sphingomonas xanthus]|uniref:CDP-alcohol phosphatidyltransferase family protein n=1 Tax=Sphingomonas xanthus TaxID=2594473 RepID=UPI00319EA514